MLLNTELLEDIFPEFIVDHCEEVPANVGVFEIRHPNFPGRFLKIYNFRTNTCDFSHEIQSFLHIYFTNCYNIS